jgi:hypothetical protein
MKNNRSLAISNSVNKLKMSDYLGVIEEVYPKEVLESKEWELRAKDTKQFRQRVFTNKDTLQIMVMTSMHEDKSLQNAVNIFYTIHQRQKQQRVSQLESFYEKEKQEDKTKEKKRGRPKSYSLKLPVSLERDISLNTAAYSKARGRVPMELIETLFSNSKIDQANNSYSHWREYRVMIADGTYLQLQDTPEIRDEFEVKYKGVGTNGYPQALLETITERGTGQIFSYKLSDRHKSEIELFYYMIDQLPSQTLLLADDLYNCYEIIAKCQRKEVKFIIPQKRRKNFAVTRKLGHGDEIIEISAPKNRAKWLEENEKAKNVLLRRIECYSPDGNTYDLVTNLLDEDIPKEEIQQQYLTRYDIELSIREIKTIMDINILRSRTPDMALKELTVSLATYNLIRKLIYASIKDLPFSPESDLIFEHYSSFKNILIDKKGRVYSKWSSGRPGGKASNH